MNRPVRLLLRSIATKRSFASRPRKMASNLPKLPDVEKLSRNVIRVMGGNPSKFTLQGSNTYLLGTGSSRILLDTGQGEAAWHETLSRVLRDEQTTISTCLISHWHIDHVGGISDLLNKVVNPQSIPSSSSLSSPSKPLPIHKHLPTLDPDGTLAKHQPLQDIHDGQRFRPSPDSAFEIAAMHCPGHTKDHMAFVVTSSDDKSELGSIFTADNVLGHGTAVFEDLGAYLDSLARMKERVQKDGKQYHSETSGDGNGKIRAYPGHGVAIEDAEAKIDEYIQHRRMREEEALNVLRFGKTTKPDAGGGVGSGTVSKDDQDARREWGSMEMVKIIYEKYPQNLHEPAEGGLLMVLEKLKKDGKVVKVDGEGGSMKGGKSRWRISEKAGL